MNMSNGFEYVTNRDETPERIKYIIEHYKITPKSLSTITGIDYGWLTNLVDGQASMDDLPAFDRLSFSNAVMMLAEGLPDISEDSRIQGVIDVLVDSFEISYETIAIYARIELEELQNFMKDANSLTYAKRYRLATVSLFLHYLFKEPPQVIG